MSQIKQILEGWGNVIKDQFNAVDPTTKKLSKTRMLECDPCPIRQGNTCSPTIYGYHIKTGDRTSGCGCNISAKTLSLSSSCPMGKW
jgi:hypothetical protein|tara:strand:- start:1193 stop:1453 length:261 start_codon:yes stop_codon:yes gene_type:complete